MKNDSYVLILKTGDAELRAIENSIIDYKNIFPIIELTRGRKSKNDEIGLIKKRLDKIKTVFRGFNICLDLTTSSSLSNGEIDELYSTDNGYQKWIDFLQELKEEKVFKSISPTILVNPDEPNFSDNLKLQVEKITSTFDSLVYRNSLADDGCYDDIELIKDIINKSGKKFYFIIDCEYIAPGAWTSFANKAKIRIAKIRKLIYETQFIVASTSYPNNISEIGKDDEDTFRLNEIDLHSDIKRNYDSLNILYGDYGSINPIRNDDIFMSRGWVPRIDVALPHEIFYKRERRPKGIHEYSATYIRVARKVSLDSRFPNHLSTNWGINQIISCSKGSSPGSQPSFWISVRMNIHIEQQIKRLNSL